MIKTKPDRRFRYYLNGRWYKGNTHVHSQASDGGQTFGELARMYAGAGYHFLFRTDHWAASDTAADRQADPLLWLDGIELDGNDTKGSLYHVVCLGAFRGLRREMGLVRAMRSARRQGGVLILCHPHWTGNSLEDALRWKFDGAEIYNHVCRWLNGKGEGSVHWNAMLERSPGTLGFAADDAHISQAHPGWNGGWIMVNASRLTRPAILEAIRRGNFYSTCGPEFHAIEHRRRRVRVRTSPVQFMRLVGPRWRGQQIGSFGRRRLSEASFAVPSDWDYAYLEIEDAQGHRAWTNPLFLP